MNSWQNFLRTVEMAREELGFEEGEECLYRGHGDISWPLLPTLLRYCRDAKLKSWSEMRDLEGTLFFEFRARARELHSQVLSDWDVLFFMRHHGVATRLLDWSETLGVAVYFALRDAKASSNPCVWLLNAYRLNEISWESRDFVAPEYLLEEDYSLGDYLVDFSEDGRFPWKEPIAIYPVQRSARLHAQRGYFTIHGEDIRPIDKIVPEAVTKIPLPLDAVENARQFLATAGIDEHSLFPDLDGLTRYLHAKYLKAWNHTA